MKTTTYKDKPSEKAQKVLDVLRNVVSEELERKRKLGHYAVVWDEDHPVLIGEDAPPQPEHGTSPV